MNTEIGASFRPRMPTKSGDQRAVLRERQCLGGISIVSACPFSVSTTTLFPFHAFDRPVDLLSLTLANLVGDL